MREWIPVSTSAKGRLAVRALEAFGRRGFDAVNVADVAGAAGVTTGALYHHFGNKLGLYTFVRDEAERRLTDRMEGAGAARAADGPAAAVFSALRVGFDFAADQGLARLLGEPHPARAVDPIAQLLASMGDRGRTPIATMLAAAWRAALLSVAGGASLEGTRAALAALAVNDEILRPEGGRSDGE